MAFVWSLVRWVLPAVLPLAGRFLVLSILPKLFAALFVITATVREKVDASSEGGKLITLEEWAEIIGTATTELAKVLTDAFANKLDPAARKLAGH